VATASGTDRSGWTLFGRNILEPHVDLYHIATAATLHAIAKTTINTAADAATCFLSGAGLCWVIFAVGLVGASLLAAAVLPLATSYAVSEAFGFSKELASISAERRFSSLYSLG